MIALDIETTSADPLYGDIIVLSVKREGREPEVYTGDSITKQLIEEIYSEPVVCHNAKFDLAFIKNKFGLFPKQWHDTMIASQIIWAGIEVSHSLDNVISKFLGFNPYAEDEKKQVRMTFSKDEPLTAEQLEYVKKDVEYLIPLLRKQLEIIRNYEMMNIYEMEMLLIPVLIDMESYGVRLDVVKLTELVERWEQEKQKAEMDIRSLLKEIGYSSEVNLKSSKQVLEFVNWLGFNPVNDKNGRPSVGLPVMKRLTTEYPDNEVLLRFVKSYEKYKKYIKLLTTYGEKIIRVADFDGKDYRIRTAYTQCYTATGRLSSKAVTKEKGMNIANIPASDIGNEIRNIFIPDEGWVFVDVDHTGQEVYIAADMSGEPILKKALEEGFDHHAYLASTTFSIIFGKDVVIDKSDDIIFGYTKKSLRNKHKNVLFAMFYGGGKNRIYDILAEYLNRYPANKRMEIAKQIQYALKRKLPRLVKFLESQVNIAKTKGYLKGVLGRRRWFLNNETVYGEAMNFPIQNAGAEAIKMAMVALHRLLNKKYPGKARIVFSIYDQLLVTCKKEIVEQVKQDVETIMAEALTAVLKTMKGQCEGKITTRWEK